MTEEKNTERLELQKKGLATDISPEEILNSMNTDPLFKEYYAKSEDSSPQMTELEKAMKRRDLRREGLAANVSPEEILSNFNTKEGFLFEESLTHSEKLILQGKILSILEPYLLDSAEDKVSLIPVEEGVSSQYILKINSCNLLTFSLRAKDYAPLLASEAMLISHLISEKHISGQKKKILTSLKTSTENALSQAIGQAGDPLVFIKENAKLIYENTNLRMILRLKTLLLNNLLLLDEETIKGERLHSLAKDSDAYLKRLRSYYASVCKKLKQHGFTIQQPQQP